MLGSNPDGNLSAKQIEFANTIYAAGRDLLNLINDILDLSKVEAGRLDISPADIAVDLYVPGCPPHPLTVLDGLLRLLGRLGG